MCAEKYGMTFDILKRHHLAAHIKSLECTTTNLCLHKGNRSF